MSVIFDIKSEIIADNVIEFKQKFNYNDLLSSLRKDTSINKFDLYEFLITYFKDDIDFVVDNSDDHLLLSNEKNNVFLLNLNNNESFLNKFKEVYGVEIDTFTISEIENLSSTDYRLIHGISFFIKFKSDIVDINEIENNIQSKISDISDKIAAFNLGNNNKYFYFKKLKIKDFAHDLNGGTSKAEIFLPFQYFSEIESLLIRDGVLFYPEKINHHSGEFIQIKVLIQH